MANKFLQFVFEAGVGHRLASSDAGHVVVLCILHSRLAWQKGKPLQFGGNVQHCVPKPIYVPAAAVSAPSPAHFVREASAAACYKAPCLPAPQLCLLCGRGFVDPVALWRHCDSEHHSWAEACKRVLWEANNLDDLPLTPQWKRRIVQNFAHALTFSQPGQAHYGRDKACMRQLVGCVVCARVCWIEETVPCYLFRDCPADVLEQTTVNSDSSDASDESATEHLGGSARQTRRARSVLRDETGYYVSSAEDINGILDVQAYARAWPLIPREELHASSVQHPSHPEFRWLLNTRRVEMRTDEPGGAEARAGRACGPHWPPCAGIADPDKPCWVCNQCAPILCARKPRLPPFALCNWNWGGRLHPLYTDLSVAMQTLLGLAILICRMIVLRYTDAPEEQEKGFTGNTILLSEPTPGAILEVLPPPEEDISKYLSVCFNSQTTDRDAVGSQKALTVDPALYARCVRLRQSVCPVFADVTLDEERLRQQYPEATVPPGIKDAAHAMDTLHTFTPTLDGPATMRAATCLLPTSDDGDNTVVQDNDAAAAGELGMDIGEHSATEHSTAPPHGPSPPADEVSTLADTPAEFIVGVQERDSHNPIDRMVVFQKSMEMVHDVGKRMHALAKRRDAAIAATEHDARDSDADRATSAACAAADLAAARAAHAAALVDLRTVSQTMGANYSRRLEEALASARMENAVANTPQTLHVKSGKPVNAFEPQAWPSAFVQFFYGDCAPNLDRPCRVPMRHLFKYLIEREELEYALPSDAGDPLIPGGCYKAPPHSRWNTPEMLAVFADTLRKQQILTTTQHMWKGRGRQWAVDMKTICSAKVQHFETLSAILARHGHQSLAQITHAAAEHKLQPLLKALQYVTFQTANIPLTQGYKVSLRQLGYGLNAYDGPLSVFLTTNFADTYSPITATLMAGPGVPLGTRSINLLADSSRFARLHQRRGREDGGHREGRGRNSEWEGKREQYQATRQGEQCSCFDSDRVKGEGSNVTRMRLQACGLPEYAYPA